MKMHKHLTTPWEAKGSGVFAGKDCIAICDTDNADQQTCEAKARLMAAAPALLSALEAAERVLTAMHKDGWKVGGDVLSEVRAAIAQAEEKPQP